MGISHSEAYAAAGVNIEAGYEGVKLILAASAACLHLTLPA